MRAQAKSKISSDPPDAEEQIESLQRSAPCGLRRLLDRWPQQRISYSISLPQDLLRHGRRAARNKRELAHPMAQTFAMFSACF